MGDTGDIFNSTVRVIEIMGYLCVVSCRGNTLARYRQYDPYAKRWSDVWWYYCDADIPGRESGNYCARVPPMKMFTVVLLEVDKVLEVLKTYMPMGKIRVRYQDFDGYWLIFDEGVFPELRKKYGYWVSLLVRV